MEPQVLPEGINPDYVKLVDGVYYDLCVNEHCRTNTGVRTDCPVEQRPYYIEGCGQLCRRCWHITDSLV
jgi:hypothetical protein